MQSLKNPDVNTAVNTTGDDKQEKDVKKVDTKTQNERDLIIDQKLQLNERISANTESELLRFIDLYETVYIHEC